MPLHTLELTDVILANGGIAQVPLFVSDACQRILEQVNTEGLFRKAGSSKRQQEIKVHLLIDLIPWYWPIFILASIQILLFYSIMRTKYFYDF